MSRYNKINEERTVCVDNDDQDQQREPRIPQPLTLKRRCKKALIASEYTQMNAKSASTYAIRKSFDLEKRR
jgi:hypothetical protein